MISQAERERLLAVLNTCDTCVDCSVGEGEVEWARQVVEREAFASTETGRAVDVDAVISVLLKNYVNRHYNSEYMVKMAGELVDAVRADCSIVNGL